MASAVVFLALKNISTCSWRVDVQRRLIGRDPDADIRIPAAFRCVSRRHAELWADRCGNWIRDLGSEAGTCINGVWIDHLPQAGLVAGDTIWLGGAELDVLDHQGMTALLGLPLLQEDSSDCTETDETPMPCFSQGHYRKLCGTVSAAEIDVLLWVSRGQDDLEVIGKALHRSPRTLSTHLSRIFEKLGMHSRSALMGWLRQSYPARGGG